MTLSDPKSLGWFAFLPRWQRDREARAARRTLLSALPRISPRLTAAIALSILVGTALSVAFIVATGHLIGAVPAALRSRGDPATARTVVVWLAVVAGLFVAQQLLNPLRNIAVGSLARKVDGEFRRRVMRASLRPTGVGHLEDPAMLDTIRDAQGVGTGAWTPGGAIEGLVQNASQRMNTIAAAVLVAQFRWWLAVLLLFFGLFVRYRLADDSLRSASWGREQTPKLRRSEYIRDLALTPDAAKETRVFGLGGFILDRFSSHWDDAMEQIWQHRRRTMPNTWSWSVPWGLLVAAGLFLAGRAAVTGEIDVGQLAVLAQATLATGAIWLSNADVSTAYGAAAVPAVFQLERATAEPSMHFAGTGDPDGLPRRSIRFEDVVFRYPGRDTDVFNGLDLEIEAGRSLAIVGRNGAGKTTLVKLLARLYEPTAGRITVDGTPLADLDPRLWQRRIGAIFQDYVRYELAVRNNVGYGAVERIRDDEALRAAAAEAGALDVVESLPHGWETVLSREYSEGAELSGGQWQRVALARALFAVRAGAGVLVLDEPTANLDVRAEAELFDRFLDLTRGLTTILISHRFSTVRHADRICVLEEGHIVEQGSHDELMASGGRYAELFVLQAARFREEEETTADA